MCSQQVPELAVPESVESVMDAGPQVHRTGGSEWVDKSGGVLLFSQRKVGDNRRHGIQHSSAKRAGRPNVAPFEEGL